MNAPLVRGRIAVRAVLAAVLAGLAACGDAPQEGAKAPKKADAKAWDGGPSPAFRAEGWTAGDRASWEQQLRQRGQQQNEYQRTQ
ncbi:MAG TPA: hypothetical protein VNV16_13460 [Methylibium sp.]|nr:hypothetical protein [Methylibium sp.]